jgi:hypothetical protein
MAVVALALVAAFVPAVAASASQSSSAGPLTLAVYGDSPYGQTAYGALPDISWQRVKSPDFIKTINDDPSVSDVVHVGDIHSGKQFCTQAYDDDIAQLWTSFTKPLIYTPGDNEWTDCHKATSVAKPGEGGGFDNATGRHYIAGPAAGLTSDPTMCYDPNVCGDPLLNLERVRHEFFASPGQTLGSGTMSVVSQATAYDPNFPTDAQYVENVMWSQRDVVFATINVPGGSNNDADTWYNSDPINHPTANTPAQSDERAQRTDADIRWLDAAFALANASHAKGVVIITQADMWDLDSKTPAHLTNYEGIIGEIAAKTTAFGRRVLMFNGDSHLYRSDNPMVKGAPCDGETDPATGASVCAHDPNNDAWEEHAGMNLNVPNFHRVVVHGDNYDNTATPPTNLPMEWLKLTVDPNTNNKTTDTSFGPFSWQRQITGLNAS